MHLLHASNDAGAAAAWPLSRHPVPSSQACSFVVQSSLRIAEQFMHAGGGRGRGDYNDGGNEYGRGGYGGGGGGGY